MNSNARSVPWLSDEEFFAGAHDDDGITVRLLRYRDWPTSLTYIANALPWVIRRPYLVPEDLD